MFQKLAIYAAIALALLVGGFAAGWHWKGVSVTAGEVTVADKTITAITDSVNKQAEAQNAQLAAEQGNSLALDLEQNRIHAAGVSIQLEIADAQFDPPPPAAGGQPAVCPDVIGSAEFVRLYNAAARGTPAAEASPAAR